MNNKIRKKIEAVFQIVLLIGMVFSFSYLIDKGINNEVFYNEVKEKSYRKNILFVYSKLINLIFDDKNLVSAQGFGGFDVMSILDGFGIGNLNLLPQDGTIGRILGELRGVGINPNQILQQIISGAGGGISMCKEMKTGSKCQIMQNRECNELCEPGQCVQVASSPQQSLSNIPDECKLGSCQDLEEGVCTPNSPKGACLEFGEDKAKWYDDPNGNVEACVKACCILGSEARFTTELQCQKIAESLGAEFGSANTYFDRVLNNEPACLQIAQINNNVACTFEIEETATTGKWGCKLTTRDECDNIGGISNENKMCSNAELNTICTAKNNTACTDGLDEVYWFDSCGNRENIVDLSRADGGWNDGVFLRKSESCVIGENDNFLKNQAMCGNCNRVLSSVCGNETAGQELNDAPDGDVVCRDLGCDDNGVRREYGETWCAYQSNFGLPLGLEIPGGGLMQYVPGDIDFLGGIINGRSIGPPGSQFFRKSCNAGEVTIEACQDARRAICEEVRATIQGTSKEISVASCRPNRWTECLNYNPTGGSKFDLLAKIQVQIAMAKCNIDPDCFVKTINVDKNFKFPICLPKYPPGFNLGEQSGGGEGVCGFASQTCPAIFVKEAIAGGFGGAKWVCHTNCDCVDGEDPNSAQPSLEFITEMSDFCTSLGDCGLKVNYQGIPGGLTSFRLKKCVTSDIEGECKNKKPVLPPAFFLAIPIIYGTQIAMDLKPIPPNKYIDGSNILAFQSAVGGSSGTNNLLGMLFGGGGGAGGAGGGIPGLGGRFGLPQGPSPVGLFALPTISGATALGGFAAARVAGAGAAAGGATVTLVTTETTVPTYMLTLTPTELGISQGITTPTVLGPFHSAEAVTSAAANIRGADPTTAAYYTFQTEGEATTQVVTSEVLNPGSSASAASPTAPATQSSFFLSPAFKAFSGAMFWGGIAAAGAGILIAVTGIGRGLGAGWSYFYTGTAFVGGAAAYLGFGTVSVTHYGITGTASAAEALFGSGAIPFIPYLQAIGIVLLVITFTMLILNIIWGVGKVKKVEVTAECKPWQPPIAVSDEQCNVCGEDGFPCNDYACSSLGMNCKLVGEHPNVRCVNGAPNDVTGPVITRDEVQDGFEMIQTDNGIRIRRTEGNSECLEDFQSVTLSVKTDEYAMCKIGPEANKNFEEMLAFAEDSAFWKDAPPHIFTISSLQILEYLEDIGEPVPAEQQRAIPLYVRCIDSNNNPSREFAVEMCVIHSDWTAPLLTFIGPSEMLPYGSTQARVSVHSNEPAEIRWSFSDKPFDEMENRFVCPISEGAVICYADVPMQDNEIIIYVRGRDHPEWIGTEREGERNTNEQSLPVTIRKSESALEIQILSPREGEIILTNLPAVTVNVEVHTSGGDVATTNCYFGDGRVDVLNNEGNGIFKKAYESYTVGEHSITIECADSARNIARKNVNFKIEIDNEIPQITRIYQDSGNLYVITDTPSECAYLNAPLEGRTNACNFRVDEGNRIPIASGSGGYVHSTDFDFIKIYHIKCKDNLGNEQSARCDIVIAGGVI